MIIGHQRQLKYLQAVFRRGRMAHAYFFYGPDMVGKKSVALECVMALTCLEKTGVLGGCGSCPGCLGVRAFSHPDLFIIASDRPLAQGREKGIGVDSIRELLRRLGLSAWSGGWRAAIIDGAQHMSFEAQSALLKIFEEPGLKTIFFIISDWPGSVLQTLRSRCVHLHFSVVSDQIITDGIEACRDKGREFCQRLAELSSGRPGLALRLAYDGEFMSGEEKRIRRYKNILGAHLDEQLRFSEEAGRDVEELKDFFRFCIRHGHSDLAAQERGFAETSEFLARAAKSLELLESTAVNRRLLSDAFFVGMSGAKGRI